MTLDGASVTLVCDNEAATFELEKNVNDPTYQLDPQQPDCDILLEIQDEVHSCTATLSIQWIEGHQEDRVAWSDLGFLAKLNVDCDTRAKAYLKTTVASSLPHPPVILSRERWGLIWGGSEGHGKNPGGCLRTLYFCCLCCLPMEKISMATFFSAQTHVA